MLRIQGRMGVVSNPKLDSFLGSLDFSSSRSSPGSCARQIEVCGAFSPFFAQYVMALFPLANQHYVRSCRVILRGCTAVGHGATCVTAATFTPPLEMCLRSEEEEEWERWTKSDNASSVRPCSCNGVAGRSVGRWRPYRSLPSLSFPRATSSLPRRYNQVHTSLHTYTGELISYAISARIL